MPEKGFISFRADNVNMDGTVFVDGCKATGLTRPFFSLSGYNASRPLRNIKFRNNYAKFNNTGSRQVGVSGISTNVVLDNSVEFLGGNLVDYSFDATHYGSTGFVTPNTDWKVINNKAYRIDINKWYLSIEPGALATIDIKNRLRSVVKFSVSGAQADNAQGIIRFTARDYSPLEAISMAGWYIAGSESEATVPNRLNMWRSEENPSIIHIKNNKDTTRAFSITLEAIL